MAGSVFNRVKTWITGEDVNASDLNAEFNNILNNLDAEGIGGYGDNVAEMQTQTDPGEVGSESLPTSLSDEIERLRFEIAQMKGETYWYTNPATNLSALNSAFGASGLIPSRLSSGATTGNSNQSVVLIPQGAGNGDNVTVKGSPTTLTYVVDDAQYTLNADVTLESQTAAPAANNTAAVNDAALSAQGWSKFTGLYETGIPIDAVGSEIVSRNGDLTCFRLDEGTTATEYILAIPDTTNNQIKNVRRGWFFDENGAQIPPIAFSDNATLTLMRLNWIFLNTSGTISNTGNTPKVASSAPATPTTGDYWFDLSANTWKVYNGVSFVVSNATLVGISVVDENGDCVAARSEDFVSAFLPINTTEVVYESATEVKSKIGARVGVDGQLQQYLTDTVTWDITTDLDTGTEANSTMYFFYLTKTGVPKVSAMAPEDFTNTRGGFYHPAEVWRCLGQAWNNASGDLEKVISYHTDDQSVAIADSSVDSNALTLEYWTSPLVKYNLYTGDDTLPKTIRFPIYQDITVPSGATLDHADYSTSGTDDTARFHPEQIVLHTVYNEDFATLGVSSHQHGLGSLVASTALGTGSDGGNLYTSTAYTDAHAKGVAVGMSKNTTAGTWASNLGYFYAKKNLSCNRIKKYVTDAITVTNGTTTELASTTAYFVPNRRFRIYVEPNDVALTAITAGGVSLFDTSSPSSIGIAFAIQINSTVFKTTSALIRGAGATSIGLSFPLNFSVILDSEAIAASGALSWKLLGLDIDSQTVSERRLENVCYVLEELPYEGDL